MLCILFWNRKFSGRIRFLLSFLYIFIRYLIDNAAEVQIQSAVRGALDRLQAEADPPVRYDPDLKLWLYLHRSRSEQDWRKL